MADTPQLPSPVSESKDMLMAIFDQAGSIMGKAFSADALGVITQAGSSILTAVSAVTTVAGNATDALVSMVSPGQANTQNITSENAAAQQPAIAIASSNGAEVTGTLASPVTGMDKTAIRQDGPAIGSIS